MVDVPVTKHTLPLDEVLALLQSEKVRSVEQAISLQVGNRILEDYSSENVTTLQADIAGSGMTIADIETLLTARSAEVAALGARFLQDAKATTEETNPAPETSPSLVLDGLGTGIGIQYAIFHELLANRPAADLIEYLKNRRIPHPAEFAAELRKSYDEATTTPVLGAGEAVAHPKPRPLRFRISDILELTCAIGYLLAVRKSAENSAFPFAGALCAVLVCVRMRHDVVLKLEQYAAWSNAVAWIALCILVIRLGLPLGGMGIPMAILLGVLVSFGVASLACSLTSLSREIGTFYLVRNLLLLSTCALVFTGRGVRCSVCVSSEHSEDCPQEERPSRGWTECVALLTTISSGGRTETRRRKDVKKSDGG